MEPVMQLNKDKIIQDIQSSSHKRVKLAIVDMDGVLRGKYVHIDKFMSALEGSLGFCDVIFGWDCADLGYDNSDFTGWHTGFPDANATLDLNTYRRVPWDNDIPFFLADFESESGKSYEICPRNLLKKIRRDAEQLGFNAVFAQEFEWFNFKEFAHNTHDRNFIEPTPISRGMFGYSILRMSDNSAFMNDIFDQMAKFRVPLEGLHTETGPGVYEAAILYSDVLEAADRAVLFKSGVKEIGKCHEIMPTFMAKWNEKLPGCSGHLHQSLWSENQNLFFDEEDPHKMSALMKHYLAGLLYCLPHVLPMYAPTINSYKRLVEGAWAPTTVTWAIDNRTTAIRALPLGKKSARIEMRVVGSDVNPYLAIAASLASGLYGIKHKMQLTIPQSVGNGYRDNQNGILPRNLFEATENMHKSNVAEALFGKNFVKHFTKTREWEWRQYSKAVTDWEFKRYFEVI